MKKMGYKRILWLDASVLPWTDLNIIFNMIRDRGYFIQFNWHNVGRYMCKEACNYFDISYRETYKILSCSAAIFGIDLSNSKTAPIIDAWYNAAKSPYAFFSPRSDQNALSIILYKMKLSNLMWPYDTIGVPGNTNNQALFLIDREFVKPELCR